MSLRHQGSHRSVSTPVPHHCVPIYHHAPGLVFDNFFTQEGETQDAEAQPDDCRGDLQFENEWRQNGDRGDIWRRQSVLNSAGQSGSKPPGDVHPGQEEAHGSGWTQHGPGENQEGTLLPLKAGTQKTPGSMGPDTTNEYEF